MGRISRFQAAERVPLSGLDMMTVMETKSFCVYPEKYLGLLRKFISEMENIAKAGFRPSNRMPQGLCSPAVLSATDPRRSSA